MVGAYEIVLDNIGAIRVPDESNEVDSYKMMI